MLRVNEHVSLPARHDRRYDQHRRSALSNPGIAEGPGKAQIRLLPAGRQAALVLLLDRDGSRNRNLDCGMSSWYPPDACMGQALKECAGVSAAGVNDTVAR